MLKLTTNAVEGETPEVPQSLEELAWEEARRIILAVLELKGDLYVQDIRHLRGKLDHAIVVRNSTPAGARCSTIESLFAPIKARAKKTEGIGCQENRLG